MKVKMYQNVGFEIVKEKDEEYLMVYSLTPDTHSDLF
jgi:hypothetical protein